MGGDLGREKLRLIGDAQLDIATTSDSFLVLTAWFKYVFYRIALLFHCISDSAKETRGRYNFFTSFPFVQWCLYELAIKRTCLLPPANNRLAFWQSSTFQPYFNSTSVPTVCQIGRTIGANNRQILLPKVIGEKFPTIDIKRTYCYSPIVLLFYHFFGI